MNLHELVTNLHELAIPNEARAWEMYWRNRIASRMRSQMHELCIDGWPAIKPGTPNTLKTFVIPGTISPKNPTGRRLTVRKDVGPYLVAFASEFHARIMPLNKYTGAYNYRQARNANKLSDHAGGVAMDINWNILAQGKLDSLTDKQYNELVALLNEYPNMGWGGFYGGGRKKMNPMYDPMHFFLAENSADYYIKQMEKKGIDAKGRIKK